MKRRSDILGQHTEEAQRPRDCVSVTIQQFVTRLLRKRWDAKDLPLVSKKGAASQRPQVGGKMKGAPPGSDGAVAAKQVNSEATVTVVTGTAPPGGETSWPRPVLIGEL